jgi:hypothetical protein
VRHVVLVRLLTGADMLEPDHDERANIEEKFARGRDLNAISDCALDLGDCGPDEGRGKWLRATPELPTSSNSW